MENYRINKNVVFAKGGESRQQSVHIDLFYDKEGMVRSGDSSIKIAQLVNRIIK